MLLTVDFKIEKKTLIVVTNNKIHYKQVNNNLIFKKHQSLFQTNCDIMVLKSNFGLIIL